MKIILLAPTPPPYGGVAYWSCSILDYYESIKSGYDIVHQDTTVKSRRITDTNLISRTISGIKETRRIHSVLKKNLASIKPDLLHITSSGHLALFKDLLLIRLASKKKYPVVIHFHFGRIPQIIKEQNWEWRLLSKVIKRSQVTIVIDKLSYVSLVKSGFKNITYIPNSIPIEIEAAANDMKLNPVSKKKGKAVFVGHIIPKKGVIELIKASVSTPALDELLLIGPFEEKTKSYLIKVARSRDNASWLKFTGSLRRNEVLEHLKNSLVLILPSYTEGFPIVVLEAMAMGCAVIATDVGAIPDMINVYSDEPCGICVETRRVDKLKSALEKALSDYDKTVIYGRNGIKRVLSSYTMSIVSQEYEKVWASALNGISL